MNNSIIPLKVIRALLLVVTLAGVAVALVACNNNTKQSGTGEQSDYSQKLYQYKETYTGDNSKVGAIIYTLNYTVLPFESLKLKTDSQPYGITVNYKVDSRAKYRYPETDNIISSWNKNAAVMFSLMNFLKLLKVDAVSL